MPLQPGHTATIAADSLHLVLAAAKLRRYTKGRTCQLCAISPGPTIEVDCGSSSIFSRPGMVAEAKKFGISRASVTPMRRGHIGRLYERTRLFHGLPEVKRTWGAGIRALPHHTSYFFLSTPTHLQCRRHIQNPKHMLRPLAQRP